MALDRALPALAGIVFLGCWEVFVRADDVASYVLPAPSTVLRALWDDRMALLASLGVTAEITLTAFVLAVASGIATGMAFAQSRMLERVIWPYAVALQVTPVVAVAPLVIIWVGLDRVWIALLILSWLVAFVPMLSHTMVGIKSVDHGMINLLALYRASRWQQFRYLQLPAALPHILAGARLSSSLCVIGAVVAEFVAGSGSSTGLAWTIIQSGNALNIPRMFAALALLSAFGITLWHVMSAVQWVFLHKWHESEREQEN